VDAPLALSSPAPLGPLDLKPARRFAASAAAPETRRAYAREWGAFSTWCSTKPRAALPATIAALSEGTATGRARKPAGIDLAAITAAHKVAGFDSPREAAEVRAVRQGIRRELGTSQREAAPLLTPELRLVDRPRRVHVRRALAPRGLRDVGRARASRTATS